MVTFAPTVPPPPTDGGNENGASSSGSGGGGVRFASPPEEDATANGEGQTRPRVNFQVSETPHEEERHVQFESPPPAQAPGGEGGGGSGDLRQNLVRNNTPHPSKLRANLDDDEEDDEDKKAVRFSEGDDFDAAFDEAFDGNTPTKQAAMKRRATPHPSSMQGMEDEQRHVTFDGTATEAAAAAATGKPRLVRNVTPHPVKFKSSGEEEDDERHVTFDGSELEDAAAVGTPTLVRQVTPHPAKFKTRGSSADDEGEENDDGVRQVHFDGMASEKKSDMKRRNTPFPGTMAHLDDEKQVHFDEGVVSGGGRSEGDRRAGMQRHNTPHPSQIRSTLNDDDEDDDGDDDEKQVHFDENVVAKKSGEVDRRAGMQRHNTPHPSQLRASVNNDDDGEGDDEKQVHFDDSANDESADRRAAMQRHNTPHPRQLQASLDDADEDKQVHFDGTAVDKQSEMKRRNTPFPGTMAHLDDEKQVHFDEGVGVEEKSAAVGTGGDRRAGMQRHNTPHPSQLRASLNAEDEQEEMKEEKEEDDERQVHFDGRTTDKKSDMKRRNTPFPGSMVHLDDEKQVHFDDAAVGADVSSGKVDRRAGLQRNNTPHPSRLRATLNAEEEEEDQKRGVRFDDGGHRDEKKEATMSAPLSSARVSNLESVVGDGTFEQLMKERSRVRYWIGALLLAFAFLIARDVLRKEKDEHSVAELRVQMTTMERALSAEVKRRIDVTSSIELQSQNRVDEMERRFNALLEDRSHKIEARMNLLSDKVAELNGRFEEERLRIPKDIERRGQELTDLLKELKEEMEVEKRDRLNREGRILKQMEDHAEEVTKLIVTERTERERTVAELKSRIQSNEEGRKDSDVTFETIIRDELKKLRDDVERETRERKMEDDEIVAALNRYTDHLQSSLSVINSAD